MSSYQVISRKWRPTAFSEVVGQEHVVRTLKNAVKTGRVGHAYLFSGPRGVGKTTVARILAKCLECVKGPTPEPCNACDMCKGITSGTAVDVLEIDGASNTGVDNIRELRDSVKYAPASGKYKIYIIDEVHMLSDSAFNALLKTLEEPPPHVVFIFATTEPHDIPLTIHSRCQRFDFRRVPTKIIHEHLAAISEKEGIDIDDDSLYLVIREAEGSLRDAQSILEQVTAFSGTKIGVKEVNEALGLLDRSVIYDLMGALLKKDASKCLSIVENVYGFGYDMKRAASELLELTRDLTVLKVCGKEASLDVSENETEKLREFSSITDTESLQLLFRMLTRGFDEVTRSSTPRHSFEMALVGACSVGDLRSTSELIARMEAMEKRGGGAITYGSSGGGVLSGKTGFEEAVKKKEVVPKVEAKASAIKEEAASEVKAKEAKAGEVRSKGSTIEDFTSFLTERSPRIGKAVSSSVAKYDGVAVTISADGATHGFLKVNADELKNFAAECFGKRVEVRIEKNEGAESKPVVAAKPLATDSMVKDAQKTLGARVIEERRRDNDV